MRLQTENKMRLIRLGREWSKIYRRLVRIMRLRQLNNLKNLMKLREN